MKTVGFDTNVLVTLKIGRQPGFSKAKTCLEDCIKGEIKIFIPLPAFLETEWVLRSFYKQPKEKIVEFFEELTLIENVFITNKSNVLFALNLYKYSKKISFTDCLILTQIKDQNVDKFLTFDENLLKLYQSLI